MASDRVEDWNLIGADTTSLLELLLGSLLFIINLYKSNFWRNCIGSYMVEFGNECFIQFEGLVLADLNSSHPALGEMVPRNHRVVAIGN